MRRVAADSPAMSITRRFTSALSSAMSDLLGHAGMRRVVFDSMNRKI